MSNHGWLIAGGWGLVAGAALVLGALLALAVELPHRVIAAVMGFGSGVLVHVLATQLIRESVESGSLSVTLGSFMVGAAVFSGANWLLSKHGAEHRNRCGGCVQQPKEHEAPGSGLAIAIGEVVDDAVIDVENILRRLRENAGLEHPRPAFAVVLDASIEVRSAVVYATFAVILD